MKYFVKGLFLLTFFFSCMGSALYSSTSLVPECQMKLYFDASDIAIDGNAICVHLEGDWVGTNAIRTDEQGFYLLREDVLLYGNRVSQTPKRWQCPYCHHWWEFGEKCQNTECPTTQWEKEKEEDS